MFRLSRLASILVPTLVLAVAVTAAEPDQVQRQINTAVDAVKPALVRIHVVSVKDRQGREVNEESFGSGVIISGDGYVVTNHHVAGHAKQMTCTLSDKTEVDADLVGTDPATDIAVIKLKPREGSKYAFARFGDSSELRVGDRVLAMGSPLALSQSVTMGIVSNTELVMPEIFGDLTLDGEDVGTLVRWIGHDARIQPGNSGGPLVSMKGEIIGINEIEIGLGGAIPGNLARQVADELIRNGRVKRSWLGMSAQPLLKSSDHTTGVLISGALRDSPAEKAGLQAGDVLLRIADKDVSVRFDEEMPLFNNLVAALPIGREVQAVVLRGGKEIPVKITPTERADSLARPREFPEWGMCATNMTFMEAKEKRRSGTYGVVVSSTRPGGPSADAKPAIKGGDVILKVGDKPVNSLDDLRLITREVVAGKDERVPTVVAFERDSGQYLTVVKLGMDESRDPGLEVKKAWIAAGTQVLTRDIAEALGIPNRSGVRVTQVYPGATAEKAGLQVGDLIVKLDGTPIDASEPEDVEVFPTMVRQYRIDTKVELTVMRDGKAVQLPITLERSPMLAREMKKYRDENFDFTARDICFFDRVKGQWPESQTGVLVESVDSGGWASLGGLAVGDLVLSVDSHDVADVEAFQAQMEKIAAARPKSLVLRVRSGIFDSFVEIRPTWPVN